MEYALLFYMDEAVLPERMTPGERDAFAADMNAVLRALEAAGALRGSQRLQGTDTATTQRVRDGKVLTTDGPFAETKESLAGLWLIECGDLEEALAWAARVPVSRYGSVEVRPLRPCGPAD
jgi:hypothetical protein